MLKNKFKVILLILVMVITLVTNFDAVSADSAYTPTNRYIINYAATRDQSAENELPYLYMSPHRGNMGIRNLQSGEMEYWSVSYEVYNLIDTLTDKSIPAYCTDACISAVSGHSYYRSNLEDSTYYPEDAAGRIRAVCMNSFPHIKDISAIEASANQWLIQDNPGATPITNLTGAEVISATQYTIWCIANENDIVSRSPYSNTSTLSEEDLSKVAYAKDAYVDCTEKKSEHTSNNIKMLHRYFMALAPVSPSETLISDESIIIKSIEHQQKSNGTYRAVINFQVNATINSDDEITVSALSGSLVSSRKLTHGGNQSITLDGLKSHEPVTIALDGGQKASGIFLFTPEGGRLESQSMVAYDDHFLPCHAEKTATCDGSEVIVVTDEDPIKPDSIEKGSTAKEISREVPQTSDSSNLQFFVLMLFLSSFLLLSIRLKV